MAGHVGGVIIKLEGFDALKRAFRELEPKLARKVIRQSVRNGMKTIAAAAKENAPSETGRGRRKIRVKTSKGPRGTKQRYTIAGAVLVGESSQGKGGPVVAVKRAHAGGSGLPAQKRLQNTWYMWLQEMGYHIGKRLRNKKGETIGYATTKTQPVVRKMEGLHFTRRAMRTKEAGVKQKMIEDILAGIEREAGKL